MSHHVVLLLKPDASDPDGAGRQIDTVVIRVRSLNSELIQGRVSENIDKL